MAEPATCLVNCDMKELYPSICMLSGRDGEATNPICTGLLSCGAARNTRGQSMPAFVGDPSAVQILGNVS